MKNNVKIILIILILVLLIIGIFFYLKKNEDKEEKQDFGQINELKKEIGITGDEQLYEVVNLGNNEQTLAVKENVKFKSSLAGMIKNSKPEIQEIDNIVSNFKFRDKGIYINKKSREKFLGLIAKFTNCKYEIDNDGYLKVVQQNNMNENDKKINNELNSDELLIIDFTPFCYIVDDVTGTIIDYPFEMMDPFQVCQIYTQGKKKIMFVTTNGKQKLKEEDIFNEMF